MIRFVAFTDLHYDLIHDGDMRIEELISTAKKEKVDFIISLGDLCHPSEENRKVIQQLNRSGVTVYYVIGNRDSDFFMQDEVEKFYNIRKDYYSFVIEETKFIVLNSCYIQGKDSYQYFKRNYDNTNDMFPVIPEVERQWLIQEMQDPGLNYVVFSHHSLANDFMQRGIANREEIREIFENKKVLMCMNGHDHGDDCKVIKGVPYYTLNSMSHIWHGSKEVFSYSYEIHKRYPLLQYMILYEKPLYAIVEINNEHISVKGMNGHYQTISPQDVGIGALLNGVSIEPKVSDFSLRKKMQLVMKEEL